MRLLHTIHTQSEAMIQSTNDLITTTHCKSLIQNVGVSFKIKLRITSVAAPTTICNYERNMLKRIQSDG